MIRHWTEQKAGFSRHFLRWSPSIVTSWIAVNVSVVSRPLFIPLRGWPMQMMTLSQPAFTPMGATWRSGPSAVIVPAVKQKIRGFTRNVGRLMNP